MLEDLKGAWRSLGRSPGFVAAAVLTLALGIGANTAIFSAVEAVLIDPLPYRESDRLLLVEPRIQVEWGAIQSWSYPLYEAFRDRTAALQNAAAYTPRTSGFNLSGGSEPVRVEAEFVSASYFPILGVDPARGRIFRPDEDSVPNRGAVAIIGHGLWQEVFGGDPSALGRTLALDDVVLEIVGVMPEGFQGLSGRAQVWLPMMMAPSLTFPARLSRSTGFWHGVVARISPGLAPQRLDDDLSAVATGLRESAVLPAELLEGLSLQVRPLAAARLDPALGWRLLVVMAAVVLVLLMACANLAGLLLTRAQRRRREWSLRAALGAGRARLLRQAFAESALLAVAGGVLALAVAAAGITLLESLRPPALAGSDGLRSDGLSPQVLAFNFAAALACAFAFGLGPALKASRSDPRAGLDSPTTVSPRRRWAARPALAILQIALATVLTISAGLLAGSLIRLQQQPLGIRPQGVLTGGISLPRRSRSNDQARRFFLQAAEAAGALPGVARAGLAYCLPLSGRCDRTRLTMREAPDHEGGTIRVNMVDEGYFQAMGIDLLAGRGILARDRAGSPRVAVVNESAARRFWPRREALGSQVRAALGWPEGEYAEVVGVVEDVKDESLSASATPSIYVPIRQFSYHSAHIVVRSYTPAESLAPLLREAVGGLDPNVPLWNVRTMASIAAEAAAMQRFGAVLLSLFAALSLTLACIGVHGVLSHSVASRRREFTIRQALGASPAQILRLLAAQAVGLTALGLLLGLASSLAATRVLSSLLFETSPQDPWAFLSSAVILSAAAALAAFRPARRTLRLEPMEALRCE